MKSASSELLGEVLREQLSFHLAPGAFRSMLESASQVEPLFSRQRTHRQTCIATHKPVIL